MFSFSYPELPILACREAILKALKENQALVVQGGTGSGKTTQLPKFLLEAGFAAGGRIGITQPRRIAALSITDRLRQETGRADLIGAKIRFHEDVPTGALVKVMTDGILLQEFRRDPLMRQYACVILDEAHERSLNVDILLGIFKTLLPRRPEFRLVVTSATLDANRFAEFLGTGKTPAPVVEVEGRQFPVALEYWDISGKEDADEDDDGQPTRAFPPLEAAAIAIRELQSRRPDNLLAFLPTEKEIHELHRELERDLGKNFSILPLYGRLGPADQRKVFEEGGRPKIILATNIAETSLTIPGIGYVVDMGLARISRYHPHTKIQGLPIERISKASARQRAGRAGRVKPGVCVRLYSETDLNERIDFTEPEILRSNLANVVLQLLALGLPVADFPFPDPPASAALKGSYRQLFELGALTSSDMDARLTEEGRKLSQLPVDVAIGKILLTAAKLGALQPALILAAGITVQDPRFTPREEPERGKATGLHRRFEDPRSDFMGVLALWVWIQRNWGETNSQRRLRALCVENFLSYSRVREWMELTEQFCRLLKVTLDPGAIKAESIDFDLFHKSILAGFMPFLARKVPDGTAYRLAGDKEAALHPGSALVKAKPEWIVAGEIRQTSRVYIFRACEIKPAWIEDLAPDACKRAYVNIFWNGERGFVEALERVTYKGFAIRQDRRINYESVDPEACAEIFWREGVIREGSGAPFPFREHNECVLAALAVLENKTRTRGLVPDEDTLVHWYRQQAPMVTSKISLGKLLKNSQSPLDPKAPSLEFSIQTWSAALDPVSWETWTPGKVGLAGFSPDTLESQGKRYRLSYRFDFGDPLDGISLETDPQGLAALSMSDLVVGIPIWRKWIWEYYLERLGTKSAEQLRSRIDDILVAWPEGSFPPCKTLVQAVLAFLKDAGLETSQATVTFPAIWPVHTQIHIFITSPNGRRFLLHVDPGMGDSELFAAVRKILFGDPVVPRSWVEWTGATLQNFESIPPALAWRGRYYGADPLGQTSNPDSKNPPVTGFFQSSDEAAFHFRIANSTRSKQPSVEDETKAALSVFFTRRFQMLLEGRSCPERVRLQMDKLRELVCTQWLPSCYLEAYGSEALSIAEKNMPLPLARLSSKAKVQVKSLAALSKAVVLSEETGSWVAVALCLGAAFVSLRCFRNWFQTLTQTAAHSKNLIQEILTQLATTPQSMEILLSPFFSAWLAKAWEIRLPDSVLGGFSSFTEDFLPTGDWTEALQAWEKGQATMEKIRKGSKEIRDRFYQRMAALNQSVSGLPQEIRQALMVLDKPVSWSDKSLAELDLELYLNKVTVKVGIPGSENTASDSTQLTEKRLLLKDLTRKNRKL